MCISGETCTKYVDCSNCENYQKHIFKLRSFPRGVFIPREKCSQNIVYFILKGEVWVNSNEHPDTIIREGEFLLQPVGSEVEFRVHTPTECMIYLFDRVQNVCEKRYQGTMTYITRSETFPSVLKVCPPMQAFLQGMQKYLKDDLLCSGFLQAKRPELFYLLNCYYSIHEIADFYAPVYNYTRSFQFFVINNYHKVKDVEDFAQLGGYSIPTFRRIFKDTFDEPVYKWLMRHKCQDIQQDLLSSDLSIKDISHKYGFESLTNFSHFCRTNFGKSPRALRSE